MIRSLLIPAPLILILCSIFSATLTAKNAHAQSGATVITEKIINGRPVTSAEMYGTVSLIDPGYGVSSSFWDASPFCTGTLIHPRVVITAGHCVYDFFFGIPLGPIGPQYVDVAAGYIKASRVENGTETAQIAHVKKIIIHPRFYIEPIAAGVTCKSPLNAPLDECDVFSDAYVFPMRDIALLILKSDITAVKSMAFAASTAVAPPPSPVQASGYGDTNDAACGDDRCLEIGNMWLLHKNPSEVLVAPAAGATQTFACFGDSGGPLYFGTTPETRMVIGATSRANLAASVASQSNCTSGDVYTFIPFYFDWIKANLATEGLNVVVSGDMARVGVAGTGSSSSSSSSSTSSTSSTSSSSSTSSTGGGGTQTSTSSHKGGGRCSFGTDGNQDIAFAWGASLVGLALWVRRSRRKKLARYFGAFI